MSSYDEMKVATEALIQSLKDPDIKFQTIETKDACSNAFIDKTKTNGLELLQNILNVYKKNLKY